MTIFTILDMVTSYNTKRYKPHKIRLCKNIFAKCQKGIDKQKLAWFNKS